MMLVDRRQAQPGVHVFLEDDEVGGGKSDSSKAPPATPQPSGLRSLSQYRLLPQSGQK